MDKDEENICKKALIENDKKIRASLDKLKRWNISTCQTQKENETTLKKLLWLMQDYGSDIDAK